MDVEHKPKSPKTKQIAVRDRALRPAPKLYLLSIVRQPIQTLRGFQKHHRIPSSCGVTDKRFLDSISEKDIDDDLQKCFSAIRAQYNLKRRQIRVAGPTDGGGTISIPDFDYDVSVGFVDDDCSQIQWRRTVSNIKNPDQILSHGFLTVFENRFNQLEIKTKDELNLEDVVDYLEDTEPADLTIDYDKDVSWCSIVFPELATTLKLDQDKIQIIGKSDVSMESLLASYTRTHDLLCDILNQGTKAVGK